MNIDAPDFSPTRVASFPEADERRAAQLVALLAAQQIGAFSVLEPAGAAERLPGHAVYVDREADYPKAAQIAAAFEAEYVGALDYMSEHGIEADPPARAGCGVLWLLPTTLTLFGALQLYDVARSGGPSGSPGMTATGVGLLAVGLLMTVVFLRLTRGDARMTFRITRRDATQGDVTRPDATRREAGDEL